MKLHTELHDFGRKLYLVADNQRNGEERVRVAETIPMQADDPADIVAALRRFADAVEHHMRPEEAKRADIALRIKLLEIRRRIPFHLQRPGTRSRVFVSGGQVLPEATPEEIELVRKHRPEWLLDASKSTP